MKLLVLLLLPLLSSGKAALDSACLDEEGNPISSQPFPIPGNCFAFYQCSGGSLTTQSCAPGTVFNPELNVCDWASNVPECELHSLIACEDNIATISCPAGTAIEVHDGFYGRNDGTTCPHPKIETTTCSAKGSLDILKSSCNGKRTCHVNPSNDVFGDPCVNTYKFVRLHYYCKKQKATKHQEVICQFKSKTIKCEEGQEIWVKNAFYGRDDRKTCPHIFMFSTSCSAEGALDKIKASCNRKNSCNILAHNSVFGNPCFGTHKYVEMEYKCRPARFTELTVCEDDKKDLSCGENQVIVVKSGVYGRTDRETCPHSDIKTTNCGHEDSFKTLRKACHGKNSCTVDASNEVFGDPCVGTYKYVHLSYKCRDKKEACVDENGEPITGSPFEKPGDCSHFYQCSNGNLHTLECAPGTAFNPKWGVCDWPQNVEGCS